MLLGLARDMAAKQGDVSNAFAAIDRIVESYQVDGVSMKVDAAPLATKAIKTPVDHQRNLEQLVPLVESLLASENYEAAKTLANMALSNARGTRDANAVKFMTAKAKEVDEIYSRYQKLEEYAVILRKNVTDPRVCTTCTEISGHGARTGTAIVQRAGRSIRPGRRRVRGVCIAGEAGSTRQCIVVRRSATCSRHRCGPISWASAFSLKSHRDWGWFRLTQDN